MSLVLPSDKLGLRENSCLMALRHTFELIVEKCAASLERRRRGTCILHIDIISVVSRCRSRQERWLGLSEVDGKSALGSACILQLSQIEGSLIIRGRREGPDLELSVISRGQKS